MATVMMPSGAGSVRLFSAFQTILYRLSVQWCLAFFYLRSCSQAANTRIYLQVHRGLPVIGSLHLLGKFPQRDFAKLAETFGPLMSIWLGPRVVVVTTSPAAAEEILKTRGSNFANQITTSISDVILPRGVAFGAVCTDNGRTYLSSAISIVSLTSLVFRALGI